MNLDFNYKNIDELLHSRLRTSIMAVLKSVDEADFNFIKNKIKATDGNLSIQIMKLKEKDYVSCKKIIEDNKSHSTFKLTDKGRKALEDYILQLDKLLKGS